MYVCNVCMYVCVCVYLCMDVCMYVFVYVCMCVCMHNFFNGLSNRYQQNTDLLCLTGTQVFPAKNREIIQKRNKKYMKNSWWTNTKLKK